MATAFSPYAPPTADVVGRSAVESGIAEAGVWSSRGMVVMRREATLPSRCVKCNAAATVRLRRKLYWHSGAIYLLVFLNLIIYAIIAAIVRKSAWVEIPLCDAHDAKRRAAVKWAWILSLAGVGVVVGAFATDAWAWAGLGFLVLLAGLIVASTGTRPVLPKKIDAQLVWLGKVSPDFVDSLPAAPAGI